MSKSTWIAVAVVATACSGPRAPFDIGTQAAPLSLTLGEHAAVQQAPVGPISVAIPPNLPVYVPPPPGPQPTSGPTPTVTVPPVVPDLGPCPPFSPIAPVLSDGRELPGPPQPATYTYRALTSDQNGATKTAYKGNSVWKVTTAPAPAIAGAYDVTTVVTLGKVSTTRVFRVLTKPIDTQAGQPDSTDPNVQVIDTFNGVASLAGLPLLPRVLPNLGTYGPAGVYLLEQKTADSDFAPTVPIPLLQTPVGPHSFTGVGSDGTTNMKFTSTVTATKLVNACGTKVSSTEVTLTDGTLTTATAALSASTVTFTEKLDFGLLFGGLPLHDEGTVSGSTLPSGGPITRTFDYTVNSVPKRAT